MNAMFDAFNARHQDIRKTVSLKDFMASEVRLFELNVHPEIKALSREQVMAGTVNNGYDFLAFNTLDGCVIIYNNRRGQIEYKMDQNMARLASMQRNGFKMFGTIETIEQFNHLMDIPDSYL